ncbi:MULTISPECIES: hypothetical protein [Streptomyces]|nr:hypothetical protein [Streptomyces sp. NRRL S-1868]
MLDIYVVAGAALVFAVWLRLQFYVLIGDGLLIAGLLFLLYLAVAAQTH